MFDPTRRYYFGLAERLGRTVHELLSTVSSYELTEWMAHDELTAADIEFEKQRHA